MADKTNITDNVTESIRTLTLGENNELVAPKSIVPNERVARAIYNKYRTSHTPRSILYSAIEGLIAGNPPYDPDELAEYKLDHVANFNNFDGRSVFDKAALAYWNLLNSAQTLIKFEFIDPLTGKTSTDPQLLNWAEIMARNWDLEMRRWPSFITKCNTLFGQLVKFGLSPAVWQDERNWEWEVIQLQRFFVSDQASTDITMMTSLCVESDQTLQYLYDVYQDAEKKESNSKGDKNNGKEEGSETVEGEYTTNKPIGKRSTPWCCEALKDLLAYYGRQMAGSVTGAGAGSATLDFMDMQRQIQNGSSTFDALYTDTIRLVSLFFKEYDGKITHIMFDRSQGGIIYRSDGQYENFQEMAVILTSSPGEFTLHSNIGVGHKLFSPCQATMRMDCSIVDLAQWASTPIVSSPPNGGQTLEAIKFYPGTPTNIGVAQFQQNNLGANINQLVGASSYLSQKLNANIANSGEDPEIPDKNQGSAPSSQARVQSFKEFNGLKHNIAHTYSQVDIIWRNTVVKMMHSKPNYPGYDAADRWKSRCIAAGVLPEIFDVSNPKKLDQFGLPSNLLCKATRVAGDGSMVALILALEALEKVAGGFGPREAKEYKRQWILATMGPDYVSPFLQDSGNEDETAGGASLAAVENAVMQLGKMPLFSPDNDQRGHIAQHLALGKHIIDQIQQQQMSPVDADPVFQMLVPHLDQHVQFISKDHYAAAFVSSIIKPYQQLKDYANLNRKNAARMYQAEIQKKQQAQQDQQQAMSEEELKNFQVQSEEKRKDAKQEGSEARANYASQNKAMTAEQKVEHDAEVKRRKVESDAANQRLAIHLKAENDRTSNARDKLAETPLPELRQKLRDINGLSPAPYDIELASNGTGKAKQ